jgi:hypothetical protein
MIKKLSTALAVVLGVIALSATPADARPGEPGDRGYLGPITSAHFAGRSATSCINYGVFSLKVCR